MATLQGMCDLSSLTRSIALEGGLSTSGLPGKSPLLDSWTLFWHHWYLGWDIAKLGLETFELMFYKNVLNFIITYEQSRFYLPFAVIELYVSSSVFFFFKMWLWLCQVNSWVSECKFFYSWSLNLQDCSHTLSSYCRLLKWRRKFCDGIHST